MRCPFCKAENDKVIDSRSTNEGLVIRRRRECEDCGKRYTTYERIESANIFLIKKDARREPFDRDKVLQGIRKACQKRPVSLELQDQILDELENMLREKYEKEVPSHIVGEFVMKRLAQIDQIAYVRFASVYREFQDVSHFMKELKTLLSKPSS